MLDRKTMQTFGIPNVELCWRMIEKNIFRPLKSRRTLKIDFSETGFEQPDQTSDNEGMVYTLIEGVYQFFWDMIKSEHMSVKQLKSFITADFLSAFLELFDSNEQNERPYLKKILHTMYAKVVSRRKLIRKSINDTLYQLIHEGFSFNGTSELLEILASIISGFGVPLREENLIFFHKIIIQLHKVQTVGTFFDNLAK